MGSSGSLIILILTIVAIGLVAYTFFITKFLNKKDENVKDEVEIVDRSNAIVNIKSSQIKIDGVNLEEYDVNLAVDIDNSKAYDVKLLPGEHSFDGIFDVVGFNNCNVVNYKTSRVRTKINLDAGHKYTLGLYLYSAEDRKKFYSTEDLVEVFEQEVNISGYEQKAYLICYQTN